uniref:Uncharacterized protein n=1 Tax=Nothobranchius furzeri TaxID=105023 RepID=A0A8C6PCD1_NOTFU
LSKAVETSCNKFQPNIFNKTKCQNCFKSREVHLLSDGDMEQVVFHHLHGVSGVHLNKILSRLNNNTVS